MKRQLNELALAPQRIAASAADPGRVSLGWIALVTAVTASGFVPIRWSTNDDPAMAAIASGHAFGESSHRLIFIGPLVGGPINLMYRLSPNIPWYYLVHLASLVAVHTLLLHTAFRLAQRRSWPIALLVAASFTWFAVSLHFTHIAILAGFVAGISAIDTESFRQWLASLAIALLAASFRVDGFLLGFLVAAIGLGLLKPLTDHSYARLLYRLAATIGPAMVVERFAYRWSYRDDEWRQYLSFNEARGSIHFTPIGRLLSTDGSFQESVGITPVDAFLFSRWMFFDEATFNGELLTKIVAEAQSKLGNVVGISWSQTYDGLATISPLVAALAASFGVAAVQSRLCRAGRLVAFIAAISALLCLIEYRLRLPVHVLAPVVVAVAAMATVSCSPTPTETSVHGYRRSAAVVLATIGVAWLVTGVTTMAHDHNDKHEIFDAQVAEIRGAILPADKLLLLDPFVISGSWENPLDPERLHPTVDVLPLGWLTFLPLWIDARDRHLGDQDLISALWNDESVALLAFDNVIPNLEASVARSRGLTVPLRRMTTPPARGWSRFDLGVSARIAENRGVGLLRTGDTTIEVPVEQTSFADVRNGFVCIEARTFVTGRSEGGYPRAALNASPDCTRVPIASVSNGKVLILDDAPSRLLVPNQAAVRIRDQIRWSSAGQPAGMLSLIDPGTTDGDVICASTTGLGTEIAVEASGSGTLTIHAGPTTPVEVAVTTRTVSSTHRVPSGLLAHPFTPGTVALTFYELEPATLAIRQEVADQKVSVCISDSGDGQ